jgi:hypothetical protein
VTWYSQPFFAEGDKMTSMYDKIRHRREEAVCEIRKKFNNYDLSNPNGQENCRREIEEMLKELVFDVAIISQERFT